MRSFCDRLSVVAAAMSDDPRQAPRVARQQGFCGLLFDSFSSSLNLPELSASGRREFRRLLAAHDQPLVGLRVDLGARGLGPGVDVDRQVQQLDRAMEAARSLEAPLVCVDLGPLPAPAAAPKPRPPIAPEQAGLIIIPTTTAPPPPVVPAPAPPDPAFVSLVNSALSEIGARADRYGVTLALGSSLASFASLHEALSVARCPWFGVDLDPVAILRDDWSRDEIFSALGPLVRHVRARDAAAGPDKRTKPMVIGRGDTNWSDLLRALDEAGYGGFISLDPMELSDRPAAATAGAKYLRLLAE
jgi:sugar phosphate isomerase/epimerase